MTREIPLLFLKMLQKGLRIYCFAKIDFALEIKVFFVYCKVVKEKVLFCLLLHYFYLIFSLSYRGYAY